MSLLISEPVAIDIIKYNNIKIILLSDRHFSLEGTCNVECSNEAGINNIPACYTVRGLIDKIIKDADSKGQYVDVYFETYWPGIRDYVKLKRAQHKQEKALLQMIPPVIQTISRIGSIDLTYRRYFKCFYQKGLCPYKNTRFHYVDIRHHVIGLELLYTIETFLKDMIFEYSPNFYTEREDTLEVHLEFFTMTFIISTFFNTPKFMDSNMWTYYNFIINSDNFTVDVGSYLDLLLSIDRAYVENTIKLLAYRYPEYTIDFITKSVSDKIETTFKLIRGLLLASMYITERRIVVDNVVYKVTIHKIRNQLLQLELQGDTRLAESIRQFAYQKFNSFDLSVPIKQFEVYNRNRMLYITTGDVKSFIRPPFKWRYFLEQLEQFTSIDAITMDLYTLGRMFRTYPLQFRKGNKDIMPHMLPSYIIEHAGAAHIRFMVEYFASIGIQKESFTTVNEGLRCLGVPLDIFD